MLAKKSEGIPISNPSSSCNLLLSACSTSGSEPLLPDKLGDSASDDEAGELPLPSVFVGEGLKMELTTAVDGVFGAFQWISESFLDPHLHVRVMYLDMVSRICAFNGPIQLPASGLLKS